MDPHRCKATGVVMTFPGQPQVRYVPSCQPELGESSHHQPRPPVSLLGVPYPRCGPSQSLFEKAEGMLQVEAPDVRAPEQIEIGFSLTMPPQPELFGLSAPLAARQPLYLHQH